jgi:uncharacterized protein (DUF2164 family)
MIPKRNIYILFRSILALVVIFQLSFAALALEKDFKEKKSTHFIVYYKKEVDPDFINDIIDSAEKYYNEIASELGYYRYNFWLWDDRAKIYIYNDSESFQQETRQPAWSGGCASYQEKTIWTYPHAAGFFDSTLPHELGHIIFREFVGLYTNIPLWFEEGVASYQEKSKRYAAKNAVKQLLSNNQLLSMQELSSIKSAQDINNKDSAEVFYSQSVSIVYFLISKYGATSFARLCKNLKEKGFNRALESAYYNIKDTDDLYKEWVRYLKQ